MQMFFSFTENVHPHSCVEGGTVTALLFLITLFFALLPISRRAHFFAHSSELWIWPTSNVQLSEGDVVNG